MTGSLHHAPIKISPVLARVSAHLDDLAGQVQSVETTVGSLMITPDAQAISQLQTLDYLRQSLEDLARLVGFLGQPDADAAPQRAICAHLRLTSTKLLLQLGTEDTDTTTSGDFDLF
ncbi:hypothetical protein [Sulfitobacter sabulilitoris]|uniref:Chemotaxis protein n=1 Tax=Sulfitobacter sabulilitoris TaxID=2562655 RepID=A0A5S3PJU0_9RHOB|nr:hypothetical protein [Sulfitobacter sabulilitoris]TMM54669.1 hypothetical protein FDT80_03520 [Sulfitobacter sabulilitoris]